jgi:hypothetical protein
MKCVVLASNPYNSLYFFDYGAFCLRAERTTRASARVTPTRRRGITPDVPIFGGIITCAQFVHLGLRVAFGALRPKPLPDCPPLLALADDPVVTALPSKCNEQRAQSFLMRSTYVYQLGLPHAEAQHRKKLHREAIAYRTRHYGYVEGFGDSTSNPRPPYDYVGDGRFFGIHVRMNSRVLVALGCVEETIQRTCSNTPYVPQMLDGLRVKNTFHNNEVSNHLYGIAIDIDPARNACCHCVAPSSDAPICRKPAKTPFDHAEIPPCWVDAFERYGFYWLGHDALEDTMHFEFLGDPSKITAAPAPRSTP